MPVARKSATGRRGAFAKASFGKLNGWRTLVLENESLVATVLPEYGGWIYSIYYKPRGVELLWQCPRGLPRRDDPPVVTDPLFAYRARTPGAWPELFPHGGGPVEVDGVKLPMHGEVVNRAWACEIRKGGKGEAVAWMGVECHLLPLRLERTLRVAAGQPMFVLEETATNYSGQPVDFMWGHHPIFGKPLLSAESRIFAPAGRSLNADRVPGPWPVRDGRDLSRCLAEGSDQGGMLYLDSLAAGWCALINPRERLGAALVWDEKVFPVVWIWREANSAKGYPYYGCAYALALEPFSHLAGARERGERLLRLEPGASLSARIGLVACDGLAEVRNVTPDGRVLGK